MAAGFDMHGDPDVVRKEFEMQLRTAGGNRGDRLKQPRGVRRGNVQVGIATALACAPLNVNPFDEPDVQEGRERVSGMLEPFRPSTNGRLGRQSSREGD